MLTQEAIEFFGGNSKAALALGISPAALSQWGERPPILRQYQIQILSDGKLKADSPDVERGQLAA